ncbi:MAG: hypothetical protein PVI57_16180, partial [Gemmatimonadota bacterium]
MNRRSSRVPDVVAPVLVAILLLPGPAPSPAAAQGTTGTRAASSGEAAFLFAYRARPGMRDAFDEGYRRHLEWHAEHADPFVWYGWDVVTGPDVGLFVDGTFGPSPEEFDRRVAPVEDAADFAATAGSFAEPLWRRIYRVRSDLGTTRYLEEREPTRFTRSIRYEVRPGSRDAFEELLGVLADRARAAGATDSGPAWSTYELLDGGDGPGYLLLVPANGIASVGAGGPVGWLERMAAGDARRVRDTLGEAVVRASSALWVLRSDLTLIPAETGPHR